MGRACTICCHPDREAIESALVNLVSNRRIATRFSVNEASLRRHKANCIKETVQALQEEREVQLAWNVVSEMGWIHDQAHLIYTDARDEKDHASSLRTLSELRKQIELRNEIESRSDESLKSAFLQQWATIREIIFAALAPFPDAKLAVARALLALSEQMKEIDTHVS